ncbi:hypothetical protein BpHYR1_024925 [Brachionus plicatilis]|uniref:Uncharacterized protein n=1 Tax=Brachionus plicatilis TaxID=10195 RepID=A0A3M7QMM9_BRAPC|nr:hypothetical protein BpHYR1_024925 [Brachionus plicatilis]
MVGKAKLFTSILNNNEENSIARDVSVKSLNNSLFQSGLLSSEKIDETRDFLERSWSDHIWNHQIFQFENNEAETTKCLKGKSITQKRFKMANHSLRAPSVFTLDTNVDIWLARFDNYLELNRIFGDRDKINVLGSFLDDTTELDIYLRGQFLAGVRDREMAEKLAVLDHDNLEMLVLRAREHEGLPFGFSGIRERSRNMFNQGTGRHITEGEIRNLITPKLESNIMFRNQKKHYENSQNNVVTIRNSYDNSFVNANLSNMSNYSKLLMDLQHDCLIGLDYMGKVQGTRDKLKEIYSSLGGEDVKNKRE